jgi:hypothetical protein
MRISAVGCRPSEDAATYTAWALSTVPEALLERVPDQATCVVIRHPGEMIGWISIGGGAPGGACNLAGEFVRLVTAAHGPVPPEESAALLVYPTSAVNIAVPRPGVDVPDFRREVLGWHAIARAEKGGLLALRPSSGGDDGVQQVNLAAAAAARQFGFARRRMQGPVMLCQVAGHRGGAMTDSQLIWLLTQPLTVPPGAGRQPAAACSR